MTITKCVKKKKNEKEGKETQSWRELSSKENRQIGGFLTNLLMLFVFVDREEAKISGQKYQTFNWHVRLFSSTP